VSDSDIITSIKPLISIFEKLGIPYYIGGSVASSAFGKARSTLDVDIVAPINITAVIKLAEALNDNYYVSEKDIRDAVTHGASFNIIHLETMLKIDVFILKKREYDQQAFERKQSDNLDAENPEKPFFLAAPEDIILNKLEWYLDGGKVSQRQWDDVMGVLKVQSDKLNMQYLQAWAKKLGINDLLEKALQSL
jgi:hypothetical protein